ncbi:MAG: putative peptidoglycan glycosyltransferase FtsW [Coprothermobacterota bacterium]|nr:putative peptidoglycan glycosyltransferase FtsW [Coprothermobacterota bacterium]
MMALCLLGILFVGSASSYISLRDSGDAFSLVKRQLIWFGIGLAVFLLLLVAPTSFWERWASWFLIGSLLLTLILFTPLGVTIGGSRRWLGMGWWSIQPSEFLKLGVVLFFSALLPQMARRNLKGWQWLLLFLLSCLPVALVVAEPDLGSATIVALAILTVFFLSGAPFLKIVAGAGLVTVGFSLLILVIPYVRIRVISLFGSILGHAGDPTGIDYNGLQALYSFGVGGVWGTGFGLSRQKFQWLPMAHNDFIFAIVAEETGLWGTAVLLLLFIALIYQGLDLALCSRTLFSRLLAGGLTAILGWQAVIHIAVSSGMLPITGITLPFISYGGSSLLTSMICCSLLARIALEVARADAPHPKSRASRRVPQKAVVS